MHDNKMTYQNYYAKDFLPCQKTKNDVKLSLGDFNYRTSDLCVRRYSSGGISDEDR